MPAPRQSVPVPLLVLALAGLLCLVGAVGILAHQRLALHQRPTVSEVKSHLKALYTAAGSYYLEKDAYTDDMSRMGFMPEKGNRYSYFSGPHQAAPGDPAGPGYRRSFASFAETGCPLTPAVLADGTQAGLGVTPGPEGAPEQAVFIGAAAADLDRDATVDCWSIASVDRVAADGTPIPRGVPHNERNDVEL